jgi:hypothetical protein
LIVVSGLWPDGFAGPVAAMSFVTLVLRAAALAAVAVPAAAEAPSLALLQRLEPGLWQLRDREAQSPPRNICIRDARVLLQLRHERFDCAHFVVEETPQSVTVTYRCGANGNGRTVLRRETGRLAQIETQGMADGGPFSASYEARRIGACAGSGR